MRDWVCGNGEIEAYVMRAKIARYAGSLYYYASLQAAKTVMSGKKMRVWGRAEATIMTTHPVRSNMKILVVDDDPDLRDLLREYLSRHGFSVATLAEPFTL